MGSYPLPFSGCSSRICSWYSSSSYNLCVSDPADVGRTAALLCVLPKECLRPDEAAQVCSTQGMVRILLRCSVSSDSHMPVSPLFPNTAPVSLCHGFTFIHRLQSLCFKFTLPHFFPPVSSLSFISLLSNCCNRNICMN